MCFAPYISLSTFIVEVLLAMFFLLKNPKDKVNRIIFLTAFLLGLYQLNEFLICVTSVNFFTRFAIIITAILPGLAVSFALIMFRKKIRYYWHILIYSPAVFFILVFALSHFYKQSAVCSAVFIQYPGLGLFGKFFGLYYALYLFASVILFYIASVRTNSKHEKVLAGLGALGICLLVVPTYIFLVFLPALYIKFPSVLCEFGLLLAINFIVVIWYKEKYKIRY